MPHWAVTTNHNYLIIICRFLLSKWDNRDMAALSIQSLSTVLVTVWGWRATCSSMQSTDITPYTYTNVTCHDLWEAGPAPPEDPTNRFSGPTAVCIPTKRCGIEDAIVFLTHKALTDMEKQVFPHHSALRYCISGRCNCTLTLHPGYVRAYGGASAPRTTFYSSQCTKLSKTSCVVGLEVESLEAVAERRRMKDKIKTILDKPSHPLQDELWRMSSSFSHPITHPGAKWSTSGPSPHLHCSHSPLSLSWTGGLIIYLSVLYIIPYLLYFISLQSIVPYYIYKSILLNVISLHYSIYYVIQYYYPLPYTISHIPYLS